MEIALSSPVSSFLVSNLRQWASDSMVFWSEIRKGVRGRPGWLSVIRGGCFVILFRRQRRQQRPITASAPYRATHHLPVSSWLFSKPSLFGFSFIRFLSSYLSWGFENDACLRRRRQPFAIFLLLKASM